MYYTWRRRSGGSGSLNTPTHRLYARLVKGKLQSPTVSAVIACRHPLRTEAWPAALAANHDPVHAQKNRLRTEFGTSGNVSFEASCTRELGRRHRQWLC